MLTLAGRVIGRQGELAAAFSRLSDRDDLAARLRSSDDSLDVAYRRLCSALQTARAIYEAGTPFVVAPVRTADGYVVRRIGETYAIAVYQPEPKPSGMIYFMSRPQLEHCIRQRVEALPRYERTYPPHWRES